MRVLLVNRFFGGQQTPTGRMLFDLAGQLAGMGHEVRVAATSGAYVASEQLGTFYTGKVSVQYLIGGGCRIRVLSWGLFWLHAIFKILFSKWDRCVILTDPPFMVCAAWLARRLISKSGRIYWWTMDLYPDALVASGMIRERGCLNRILRWVNVHSLKHSDGVIALGHRQLARIRSYITPSNSSAATYKAIVVPPWDLRPIARVKPEDNAILQRHSWQNIKIALYAGNLGRGHEFRQILAAAQSFKQSGRTDWVFLFVVRGAEKAALVQESAGLDNVVVMDYLSQEETPDLLWSATVHLITMKPGWEGVIVPSKLYGVLQTDRPILFIGPLDADTAVTITDLNAGIALSSATSGELVCEALDELAKPKWTRTRAIDSTGPKQIADFILQ